MDKTTQRAKRFYVDKMHIVYDTGEGFWSAPVVDVSETGLFVETRHQLPKGTKVTIVPVVANDEQLPFEIFAEVVRLNEYDMDHNYDRTPGIAFCWSQMEPEHIAQVRAFLEVSGAPLAEDP